MFCSEEHTQGVSIAEIVLVDQYAQLLLLPCKIFLQPCQLLLTPFVPVRMRIVALAVPDLVVLALHIDKSS